jgi:hypothetical protein
MQTQLTWENTTYWQLQLKPNKRNMTHFLIREPDSKNIWVFAMQKSKMSYVITPFAVLRIDCIYDDVIQWFTIISQKGSLQGRKFDFHWIAFLKLERYVFDTRNSTVHIHKNINSKRQEAAYKPLNSDLNIAPHAIADWCVLWLKSRIWNRDHITIFQRKKRTCKITHRSVGSQDSWHLKTALQTCQKGREKSTWPESSHA